MRLWRDLPRRTRFAPVYAPLRAQTRLAKRVAGGRDEGCAQKGGGRRVWFCMLFGGFACPGAGHRFFVWRCGRTAFLGNGESGNPCIKICVSDASLPRWGIGGGVMFLNLQTFRRGWQTPVCREVTHWICSAPLAAVSGRGFALQRQRPRRLCPAAPPAQRPCILAAAQLFCLLSCYRLRPGVLYWLWGGGWCGRRHKSVPGAFVFADRQRADGQYC